VILPSFQNFCYKRKNRQDLTGPDFLFASPLPAREGRLKESKSFRERGTLPYFALTLTAFLFGLSFVATKYALEHIPPFTLIFLRFLIAFVVLGISYRLTPQRKPLSEDRV